MGEKLIYIILFVLFTVTMWIGVFPVSIEKAIEKQGWNNPFLTEALDNKSVLLFIEKEKGEIRLASAYRGTFGWKITDRAGLISVHDVAEEFSGSEGVLIINKKKLHYLLGVIVDENINSMTYKTASTAKEKGINTFTTTSGMRIYYTVVEPGLGNVTYYDYSLQK